jgi:hypothetical protein
MLLESSIQTLTELMTFATIGICLKWARESHTLNLQHALHMASLAGVPNAQKVSINVNRALADC